ncbi:ABC transporter ATP-binding protein/permease [Clostridioides difficile]|uniref:ABC transporter ATP-binding protein/permease n=2 Tax=Clostridioides difficile TaxID=1496 RepID=UPI0011190D6B|nr:ABC transporter ATP-binding protein/permease [Clostridioides difficile]MBH7723367.1 ABC transporter ATP-binding protein [Clostridioides difficile]MDL0187016.1 ABC transporter ATP-binding protein/permease [Clostridioides difficile]MDU2175315.1 ABC transporter ATP-binding protein/permease [Clostridioides difficile]HBF6061095.1 ABC transporter ATP-binding protein [Clostridioides difficile]HBF6907897.1 ABC transporter ATP-binding protein [Clostridioides difficile]
MCQRPVMINDTIKENLLYLDINATVDEVNQVCEKVGLEKFIEALPDKFDTILETLSGG